MCSVPAELLLPLAQGSSLGVLGEIPIVSPCLGKNCSMGSFVPMNRPGKRWQ